MTRVAWVGNIASNAYNGANLMRRAGIDAYSFDLGGGNPAWTPQWEEGYFDQRLVGGGFGGFYQWSAVPMQNGYARPSWAKIIGYDAERPWYDTQKDYETDLIRLLPRLTNAKSPDDAEREAVRTALAHSRLSRAEQREHFAHSLGLPAWRAFLEIGRAHDLTILCGPAAQYGVFFPPDVKYVALEHSTMRHVHLFGSAGDAAIVSAYLHADWNVLTNADCREAARCMGLERYSFIPHPVDETAFCPDESTHRAGLLNALPGTEVLLFAPARHSNSERSGTKRNDRAIYAFKRYVDEMERSGAGPRAALMLVEWGEDLDASRLLCRRLGLSTGNPRTDRVIWMPMMPKPKVREVYRAADVVLDQFSATIGSFGTTLVEAMACAKPVVSYVSEEAHAWCTGPGSALGELPPVCNALTTEEVYGWLRVLLPGVPAREIKGNEGRRWVELHHSSARVVALWQEVIDRVVDKTTDGSAEVQGALAAA